MKNVTANLTGWRQLKRAMKATWLVFGLCLVCFCAAGSTYAQARQQTPGGASVPASAVQPAEAAQPLPRTLTYTLLIGMTAVWVLAALGLFKGLRAQGWKVKDALMEEAVLPAGTPPPAAGATPPMVPSTSRLIALIGTIVLGTFFVTVGYIVLWDLCEGHSTQAAQNAWTYFAGGSALFLPYGVNKLSNILK